MAAGSGPVASPEHPGRRRWALISAAALAVLAVLVASESTALLSVVNHLWPLPLIASGGFLLWRALGWRRTAEPVQGSGERVSAAGEEPGPR